MTNYVTNALRQELPENISNMFNIFENENWCNLRNNQMLVLAKNEEF